MSKDYSSLAGVCIKTNIKGGECIDKKQLLKDAIWVMFVNEDFESMYEDFCLEGYKVSKEELDNVIQTCEKEIRAASDKLHKLVDEEAERIIKLNMI